VGAGQKTLGAAVYARGRERAPCQNRQKGIRTYGTEVSFLAALPMGRRVRYAKSAARELVVQFDGVPRRISLPVAKHRVAGMCAPFGKGMGYAVTSWL